MFIKPNPPGVNRPLECDRTHIVRVVSGDVWKMDVKLVNPTDGTPADYKNTFVNFVLSENKFSKVPIWTGKWFKGVFSDSVIPGLSHVVVPESISRRLRRGTYAFSMTVTDTSCLNRKTEVSGYFEVEYEPSSPLHDIPYREDGTGSKAVNRYIDRMDDDRVIELQKVIDEILTGDGSIHNMEEGLRIISEFLVAESTETEGCEKDDNAEAEAEVREALTSMTNSMTQLATVIGTAIQDRFARQSSG